MNFYSNVEKQRIIFEAYENPKFKIKNDEDFKKTDKTLFELKGVQFFVICWINDSANFE